jgi:protein O-GlcNAc transferase
MNNKQANRSKQASSGFGGISKKVSEDYEQAFNEHLAAHEWIKASLAWKKVISRQKKLGLDTRETLKSLIFEGRDHMQGSDYGKAATCYCKALALDSSNLDCLRNLAIIDLTAERAEQALNFINQAICIRSDIASLWSVKAQCLGSLGRHSDAKETIDHACTLGLSRNDLLLDLAIRLMENNPDESINITRSLFENISPSEYGRFISLIGVCRRYACFDLEEKVDWWNAAFQTEAQHIPAIALNLYPLAGTKEENMHLCKLLSRHKAWCAAQCKIDPLVELERREIGKRQIRIGIVSGDFRNHVVARFLLPLLENLDQKYYELVCLSTRSRIEDESRKRFEAVATFIDIVGQDAKKTAEIARKLDLDVCIDAAGFTAYSSSQSFAWRMAPIQLNMIGYPGSTFVPNMDLLLSDSILKPEYTWMHHEELLGIEGLAYCMDHPDEKVKVNRNPPQIEHGFINFGILVNPFKYDRNTIRVWADVLKATPNSQMAIVRPECRSLRFQENIITEFAKQNIPSSRIIIVNNHGRNIHHLDCYNKIDVILDSMPMTGGTSTYEAVLMGLPVITLDGPNYHQRISKTILHHAGMSDCIAHTEAEYIAIASSTAQNLNRLKEIRQNAIYLRNKPGGLCDGKAYAERFELSLLNSFSRRDMLGDAWRERLEWLKETSKPCI